MPRRNERPLWRIRVLRDRERERERIAFAGCNNRPLCRFPWQPHQSSLATAWDLKGERTRKLNAYIYIYTWKRWCNVVQSLVATLHQCAHICGGAYGSLAKGWAALLFYIFSLGTRGFKRIPWVVEFLWKCRWTDDPCLKFLLEQTSSKKLRYIFAILPVGTNGEKSIPSASCSRSKGLRL